MCSRDFHAGDASILYSPEDRPRVLDLFWLPVAMMQFMSQIPLKLERLLPLALHGIGTWVSRCYCVFIIFTSFHLGLLFTKTFFDNLQHGQLEDITDALSMAIIFFFIPFGICYWLYMSPQLVRFLTKVQREYRHHSLAGVSFVTEYDAYAKARNIALVWYFLCFFGAMFWGLTPIWMHSRTLPLKCWYPFDELAPFVYEIIYATQLFAQLITAFCFANNSALFIIVCTILLAQFDVLYCSLKNLDYHARILAGAQLSELRALQSQLRFGSQDELNQYCFLTEYKTDLSVFENRPHRLRRLQEQPQQVFERELHAALVECVQLHRFILECCDELEELYNPYCLITSLQIITELCLIVFVGVSGEHSTMRVINQLQYLLITCVELFIFTYYGELLRCHSVRAGEAYWRSEWWPNANAIGKDVLIFLTKSRREVRITAGKFYIMDMERLRSVVKQAFSFFTLLQTLAAKKDAAT